MTDPDDVRALAQLFSSALVSDALDAMGHRYQALGWDIVPRSGDGVVVGRAFPVAIRRASAVPETPYVGLLRALDSIDPGDIFVIPTGRATDIAVWGELLSTVCLERGAVGAVTDGLVRDIARTRRLGFPVLARGTLPSDISGRAEITAHRVTCVVDGVEIRPRDLIVADDDGILVVPEQLTHEVVERVTLKTQGEARFRRSVRDGASASSAYAEWGVL